MNQLFVANADLTFQVQVKELLCVDSFCFVIKIMLDYYFNYTNNFNYYLLKLYKPFFPRQALFVKR